MGGILGCLVFNVSFIKFRAIYILSPYSLHKVTYLCTNSLISPSRVLTFHFVTFGGINVNCLLNY
ncbi:hypothetical protein Hanom_Chr00s011783g01748091 [Helianthus anomalus]